MSSQRIPWSALQGADFPICDLVIYPNPDPSDTNLSAKLCTRGPIQSYMTKDAERNLLRINTAWYAEYNPVSMRWVRKTTMDIDTGGVDINTDRCYVQKNGDLYLIYQDNGVVVGILVPHSNSILQADELL